MTENFTQGQGNPTTSGIKAGISKDRIKNIEKVAVIEELIKCSICFPLLTLRS